MTRSCLVVQGRADLVAAAGARLTAPGVGLDAGAVPADTLRLMFQGALRLPRQKRTCDRAYLQQQPCWISTAAARWHSSPSGHLIHRDLDEVLMLLPGFSSVNA